MGPVRVLFMVLALGKPHTLSSRSAPLAQLLPQAPPASGREDDKNLSLWPAPSLSPSKAE